jgi:hypothetical protein
MRDGYVVTWQGREYDAAPDGENVRVYAPEPADGFEEVRPGRYVRVLSPASSGAGLRPDDLFVAR